MALHSTLPIYQVTLDLLKLLTQIRQHLPRTRTTSSSPGPSADRSAANHAGPSFDELVAAYFDCRRHKRNTKSALVFELDLERNLVGLFDELAAGVYRPGPSICFVVTRPKPREVWAAAFRDRIVHHLLYNRVGPRFERAFIADSCACIAGRGTLYAIERLESKVRGVSANWSRPAWYLKCDVANFFVAIDKNVLAELLEARIPAGNLSSQFFANVYLDRLDQFAKHTLRARHYVRYVDDFILLHESRAWLQAAHDEIAAFLPRELHVALNPAKTILQPVARGVDFAGQVIKPWHRRIRRRTFTAALQRTAQADAGDVRATANSYFGLLRQATAHQHDRELLARLVRRRGHPINRKLTKAFP
jgi:RNA-directed DNA polymerase